MVRPLGAGPGRRRRGPSLIGRGVPARLLILLAALPLARNESALAAAQDARPELRAVRVEAPPALDGSVRDDPVWQPVPAADAFWQTTPDEGRPASERTEVRVVYTRDTLYIGVVCYDREPDRMIVSETRRDAPLEDADSFQVVLDTFRDGQNGFVFGTNPAGIEYDGQVVNEGRGGERGVSRQQTGAGSGFNLNWDGSWEVRTRAGDFGWSAEFAVPFRTLRYEGQGAQTWGVNFQRSIRRRKEVAFWAPLTRQYNLFRISQAGALAGLEPPAPRNLKVSPYVLGEARRDYAVDPDTGFDGDAGADLKYSVTSGLTLDLTVNTDFAQVEVDEQQINLDRFNLFFPEKRPFFLENAGQFAVGLPSEVEIFFSRRIGIGPGGEVVPILAGGRLSGRVAGTNVGVLNMQTRSLAGVTAANNVTVARVNRALPNRSAVGGLFVNRQGTGRHSLPGDHNRAFALDGRWGVGRHLQLSGFAARTVTPGRQGHDGAWNASASYETPGWTLETKYTDVGEGFNPEVGFLARQGYRKPDVLVLRRYRPQSWLGLHELRPHVSYRGYWKPDGFQESGFLHMDCHWEWKSGHEVHTGLNLTREGVAAPFEIYPGVVVPVGSYDHKETQLVLRTNQGAAVSFDGTFVFGGFFGGHRASWRPSMRLRVGEAFNLGLRWDRNDIDLPEGRFVTNLARARISYAFTPRLFVQGLLQYNDRDHRFSTNWRFGWLQTANTGLFVVFNENRDAAGLPAAVRDRSLTVKFSRLIDVLD